VLVKYVNGSPVQFDLNANFLLKETLWLGASLRSMDSVDLLAESTVKSKFAAWIFIRFYNNKTSSR
jgi:hypothetical protein